MLTCDAGLLKSIATELLGVFAVFIIGITTLWDRSILKPYFSFILRMWHLACCSEMLLVQPTKTVTASINSTSQFAIFHLVANGLDTEDAFYAYLFFNLVQVLNQYPTLENLEVVQIQVISI